MSAIPQNSIEILSKYYEVKTSGFPCRIFVTDTGALALDFVSRQEIRIDALISGLTLYFKPLKHATLQNNPENITLLLRRISEIIEEDLTETTPSRAVSERAIKGLQLLQKKLDDPENLLQKTITQISTSIDSRTSSTTLSSLPRSSPSSSTALAFPRTSPSPFRPYSPAIPKDTDVKLSTFLETYRNLHKDDLPMTFKPPAASPE